jgi:hypothetical protein
MEQSPMTPMAWARMPARKMAFGKDSVRNESVRETLTQILVKQMGIAEGIYLVSDPDTGTAMMDIHLYPSTQALPELLVQQEVKGVPVRYTLVK